MRKRTFKYKSPEWFGDVVVTVVVTEHDSGQINLKVKDPKKLIGFIDHQVGYQDDDE